MQILKRIVIPFLLLILVIFIFFMWATTIIIDSDEGLTAKLPAMPETEIVKPNQKMHNVLNILVNGKDQILVNNDIVNILYLKQMTVDFINNCGLDPTKSDSPDKAIIALKSNKGATYEMYLSVHKELKAAYNIIWNEEAVKQYGRSFENLNNEERKAVREIYPYKILEE